MKKNILAENMLRFGVKNLSESDVTRLTEVEGPTVNDVEADMNTVLQALNSQFAKTSALYQKNNPETYGPLLQKIKVSNNPRSYSPFSFQKTKGSNLGDAYKVMFNDGVTTTDLTSNAGTFGRPEANINQLKDLPVDLYQGAFIRGLTNLKADVIGNRIKGFERSQLRQMLMKVIDDAAKQLASSNVIANRWKAASDAVGKQQP